MFSSRNNGVVAVYVSASTENKSGFFLGIWTLTRNKEGLGPKTKTQTLQNTQQVEIYSLGFYYQKRVSKCH